ncbi:MAG TPA: sorbosone dehydrogenase family protein [Steroidobacteraceae bacterium]|nr:sorbosone dehydrogenase family protein [Steroidobacteraceae bacterium]
MKARGVSNRATVALAGLLLLAAAGCGDKATLPVSAGFGPHPVLPPPHPTRIPTLNFARAVGWPAGATPTAAPGLAVRAYATDLVHPRWLQVLPNGDVLVAESDAPADSGEGGGFRNWLEARVMRYVGAGTPSADRITLLRGVGANGRAQVRSVFLRGLHSPFGMALVGSDFYVANTDAILRFPYASGATAITVPGVRVLGLPAQPDGHWTRDLIASRDGSHLYVTVGSDSNIGEHGMNNEVGRAAVHEIDLATGRSRIFASGLRNPNGLAWEPHTGALWAAINERDELGSDLVPDYMTSLRDGAFYGWPYSYYGQHVDERVQPARPDLVASAIAPDYALGAHTASLGLAFYVAAALPGKYAGGAFIGQHGSWNRNPRSGYKVIFVPFADGHPAGPPEDVLTDFLSAQGEARGRPVGVAVDGTGALLVADDVGNVVWRVTRQIP